MDQVQGPTPPGKKEFQKPLHSNEVGRRPDGTLVEPVYPDTRLPKGELLDGKPIQDRDVDSLPFAAPVLPRPLSRPKDYIDPFSSAPASTHAQVKSWLKEHDEYSPLEVAEAWARHGPQIQERLNLISEAVRQGRGINVLRARGQLPDFQPPVTADYVLAAATMLFQIGMRQAEVQQRIKTGGKTEQAWLAGLREFNHLENLRKELDRSVGQYFSSPPAPQSLPEPDTGQLPSDQQDSDPPDELLIDFGSVSPPSLPKPQLPPRRSDPLTGQVGPFRASAPEAAGNPASDELHRDISDLKQKLDDVTHLLEGQGRQLTAALSREQGQQEKVRALQQRVVEQQGTVSGLEVECNELRLGLQAAQKKHDKQLSQKQGYIEDLEEQLGKKEAELSDQLVKHSLDVGVLREELESLNKARQEVQFGLEQMEFRAKGLGQEKEHLEARLATAYDALLRVNLKRVDNLEALKKQDAQIAALRQSERQLQQSASTLQALLGNARKELEESQQRHRQLTRYFGRTLGELSAAKKAGTLAVKSLEQTRLDLDKVRNERALLEKTVAAKSKKLEKALKKAALLDLERQAAVDNTDLLFLKVQQSDEEKYRLREQVQGLSREVSGEKQHSGRLKKELEQSSSELRDRERAHVELVKKQTELVQSLAEAEKSWYSASEQVSSLQRELHTHEDALINRDNKIAELQEQLSRELERSSLSQRGLEESLHHEKGMVDHFQAMAKELGDKCHQLEELNADYQRQLQEVKPEPAPENQVSLDSEDLWDLQKKEIEQSLSESQQRETELKHELEKIHSSLDDAIRLQTDSATELQDLAEEKKNVELLLETARKQRGQEFIDRQGERQKLVRLQRQHDRLRQTADKQRASLELQLQGSQQSEKKLRDELKEKEKSVSDLKKQMHLMEIRLRAELMKSQVALHATEKERDGLTTEFDEQKVHYEKEIKQLQDKQEQLVSEAKAVSQERAEYLREVTLLREEKSKVDQDVSDKSEELGRIQSTLDSTLTELGHLRESVELLEKATSKVKELETAAEESGKELIALKDEVKKAESKSGKLERELSDREEKLSQQESSHSQKLVEQRKHVEELELKAKSLSDDRDGLARELAKQTIRSGQLETERRMAVAHSLSLAAKVSVLEKRHAKQLEVLESEKLKLSERLKSQEIELSEKQSAFEIQKAALESVQGNYSQASAELDSLRSQYSGLESSSTASASDLVNLKDEVRKKAERVTSLESQVSSLSGQLSDTERKLSDSQSQLQAANATVSDQKQELEKQEGVILESQQKVKDSECLLSEARDKLKKEQIGHADYEKIKTKLKDFREEYKKERKFHQEALSRIKQLHDSERALKKAKALLYSKVSELETQARDLEKTRTSEGDRNKAELAQTTSEKERLAGELLALNNEMTSLQSAKGKAEEEVSTLSDRVQSMEHAHEEQVRTLEQQASDTRGQLDILTKTHEELSSKAETLGRKADSLESQLSDSGQKVIQLEAQLFRETEQVAAGKQINKETERALEKERQQAAKLGEQVSTVNSEKAAVQAQVDIVASELEQLKAEHKNVTELETQHARDLTDLTQQNEEMRSELEKSDRQKRLREKRKARAKLVVKGGRFSPAESGFQSDSSSGSSSSGGVSPREQKHFLIRSEINDWIRKLTSIDKEGMDVSLVLLFDQLLSKVQKAESSLYLELERIDKQEIGELPFRLEKPPSFEESRQEKIRCCDEFRKFLSAERTKFVDELGDNDDTGEDILESVDDLIDSVDELVESVGEESEDFIDYKERLDSAGWKTGPQDSLSIDPPDVAVDKALVGLRSALRTSPGEGGEEKRAYAAGVMATKMNKLFVANGKVALEAAREDPDQVLMELERQRQALCRLLPENLPLDMESQIPPAGLRHLSHAVNDAIVQLEATVQGPLSEPEDVADPRGSSGAVLARRLIHDPNICPSVIALLGSLQSTHGGISKTVDEYDYHQASSVGLKCIRDEHGLVDMPTMLELLQACEEDLKRPGSVLLAEAVRQHRGQYKTKGEETTRREKLEMRCQKLRQEMEEVSQDQQLRNQSTHEGVLAVHPHRSVLDCFVPGAEGTVVKKGDTVIVRGPYSCYPLPPDSRGLFNTFFDGAGGAELRCNTKTGDQYLQLTTKDCIPAGVIFKSKGRDWQVELDQTTWTVHPGFLLDHPNFVVPFEAEKSGKLHRDWLPLRDAAGNTALLVLRKTPGGVRYFLYETGKEQVLKPRLIGPDYSVEERREAEFLCQAASAPVDPDASDIPPAGRLPEQVTGLKGSGRNWLKCPMRQLQTIHAGINAGAAHQPTVPLVCSPPLLPLNRQRVQLNTLREVARTKDAPGKAALVTCVGGEEKGQFARFSVDATFDLAGQTFLQQKAAQLGEKSPLVRGLKADQAQFRAEAFRDLIIYSGCELTPLLSGGTPDQRAPARVQENLEKVIKINRDHCMRAAQSRAALERGIISDIRAAHQGLSDYTDREVLVQAIREFEVGRIPAVTNQQPYIKRMTDLMMVENDLLQSSRVGRELQGLKRQLHKLEVDVHLMDKRSDAARYQARCQQWNLEMALLATRQKAINDRLESYGTQVLNTETLAMLSFERQTGTILRPNQVQEVSEALRDVTDSLENNKPMSRISHKGTGWGKSTILQLLTDHALLLAKGRKDLSVLVVAPESNQAELDITLGRYYAKKGRTYRRLNMVAELKKHNPHDPKTLDRVHNILLGLDPTTARAERKGELAKERAPVGVSIKDIQILMHMRNAYIVNDAAPALIQRLDGIMDLMRESMSFCDEWDSAMMPHRRADLEAMAEEINETLTIVRPERRVTPHDIIRSHGEFVLGSRRKQLLSATIATPYTAAMASRSLHPEIIKTNCNTDPLTTNQRFWHWMCSATPVYFSSKQGKGRAELLDQVVDRVGVNRQVMVFDGRDSGQDVPASARAVHGELNKARVRRGGQVRETLFYDKQKHLKKYQPDESLEDQAEGLSVSEEEEAFLRATRGASVDVFLTQRESVGTDAPQGQSSVGVYMGLFQQGEEGREDLTAQQIGRLMRASNELRSPQTLLLAVDMDALDQVREGAEKKALTEARKKMQQEWEVLEASMPSGDCSHEQMSCINSPLSLTPPEPGSLPEAVEHRLEQELDRLSETHWLQAGLSDDQIGALRKYKKAEWTTKKALLELTAVELARREVTSHTTACETLLSEARVNSCLEYEAALEEDWLKSMGVRTAGTYQLPDSLTRKYSDPRVHLEIEKRFRSAAQNGIRAIPRRKVEGATSVDGMPDFIDPERTKEMIRSNMEVLRRNGLKSGGLDELAVEMESLKQEGLARLREALGRVERLVTILSETTSYGLQSLKKLKTDIAQDIERVEKGKEEDTLNAEDMTRRAYKKMFTGVLQVGIGQKSTGEAIKSKAFLDVKSVMEEVFDVGALQFAFEQRAVDRLGVKVPERPKDVVTDKFTFKKRTKHSTLVIEPAPSFKLQESVLGNPDSEESLHARTLRLRGNKDWRDKVQAFCASPQSPLFQEAVNMLQKRLLYSVDYYAKQQKPRFDEEMAAMHQQEKMMQQQMMITVK